MIHLGVAVVALGFCMVWMECFVRLAFYAAILLICYSL
jgi:hypothetical protein